MIAKSKKGQTGVSIFDNPPADTKTIAREKVLLGAIYGTVAGIIFAIALWAWDSIQLMETHAFFPWLNLVLGIFLCGTVGGIAGWMVGKKDSALFSFLIWLTAAAILAWITVGVPLQITPVVAGWLNPELSGQLNYMIGTGFATRFGLALLWVTIFLSLTGMLQLTLVETAVFSASLFSRVAPFAACAVLMGVAGFVIDELVNVPLRKAMAAVEIPIQFVLDHRGQQVDPALSRKSHAGSLRGVLDSVTESRQLIVSSYDDNFFRIDVLVHFEDAWVNCITVNSQASHCAFVEINP